MQAQLVSAHGMLAILEVLESKPSRDVIIRLLEIINLVGFVFIYLSRLTGGIAGECGSRSSRKLLFNWVSVLIQRCHQTIYILLAEYLSSWVCSSKMASSSVLSPFSFYIQEIFFRVPPGGLQNHSTSLPHVCLDIANVYIVSLRNDVARRNSELFP